MIDDNLKGIGRDMPLGVSMRVFTLRFNCCGEIHPGCDYQPSMYWGPGWNTKEKANEAPECISACRLSASHCCHHAFSTSMNWLCSQTVSLGDLNYVFATAIETKLIQALQQTLQGLCEGGILLFLVGKEPYTINEWVEVDLFYSDFIHNLYIKGVEVEDSPSYSTKDCVSFFDP